MAEAARRSAYSYKRACGHPPHTRGTNGKIIGRHKSGLRKHTISLSHLITKNFPTMSPKNRQVPPSGHTVSHAPFTHPKHQQSNTGRAPPTAQGTWGEEGNTQSQSTLILIGGIFIGKNKTAASPTEYHFLALNVHNTVP